MIPRRRFLTSLGLGAMAMGSGATLMRGLAQEASRTPKGLPVSPLRGGDAAHAVDPAVLQPMAEHQTIFSRNGWDPSRKQRPELGEDLTGRNLGEGKGVVPNQTRLDYALMASGWALARAPRHAFYDWETQTSQVKGLEQLGRWNPADLGMGLEDVARAVKNAAHFHGASVVGIARLNPLWIYQEHLPGAQVPASGDAPKVLRESLQWVVVLAFEEDFDGIANSPGRLASAATANGYSRMATTAFSLAEFIRALGYTAIPCGNDTGLSIPMAIDAGLGELGRNGLLITPQFGPRVRLAKVLTDLPMAVDRPIRFGVAEFCETCMLCAEQCPSGSISKGAPTWQGRSPSNNPGARKWYVHPESCYDYNGFSCSNCKRSCPFNKPNNSWLHKLVRVGIRARFKGANTAMVTLDKASEYGHQVPDKAFWRQDGSRRLPAREAAPDA